MTSLLQAIEGGITMGCVYALIALSVVIVYKSSAAINFAGGELVMIGSFAGIFCLHMLNLPYLAGFVIAGLVTAAIGGLFERVVVAQISRHGISQEQLLVPIVIATFGLSYLLKGAMRVLPYTEEIRSLRPFFSGPALIFGAVIVERQDVTIVVFTLILFLIVWLFFTATASGRALSATSQNARAAALIGIPVPTMRSLVWGLSGGIAGIAGMLVAPKLLVTPDMGSIIILALAAAVVGGFSNLPGTIAGGIVVGVTQNILAIYLGSRSLAAAPFIITMLVLILRPEGLFARPAASKKV